MLLLTKNDVHVWSTPIESAVRHLDDFTSLLSKDECSRAERFSTEALRKSFIVCHGLLRSLLGKYLDRESKELRFVYGPSGKPSIDQVQNKDEIQFSMSHTEGMVFYAFTRNRRIGVDVERPREVRDFEKIVERYFSAREHAELMDLPPDLRPTAFFKGWTGKEALLKATGEGLTSSLNHIEVSLDPRQAAQVLSIEGSPEAASHWTLKALDSTPGYIATLAVEGSDWQLREGSKPLAYLSEMTSASSPVK